MNTLCKYAAVFLFAGAFIADADERTQTFLKTHCIRCHGPQKQKADRRFDTLPARITKLDDLERYQEIVDLLNLGEMPPEDETQPAPAERAAMIAHLTGQLKTARAELSNAAGGRSVLRRLNSWEYRQTIGELFGLNVDVWNPAEDFPEEVKVHGFDNNGAELVTSGRLMDHYFIAAEEAIRRSTQFGPRPVSRKYAQQSPFYFKGKEGAELPKLFQVDRFRYIPDTPYTDLVGRHYRGGHIGFAPLHWEGGVAHSGIYTIRVRAAAVDRVHDYGKALGDFRNGDPLVMELAAVDRRGSVTSTGNVSKMTSLARVELTSEKPQWFEWTVFMEAGYEPEVRFRNGPLAAKRMVRVLTTLAADKPEFKPFVDMKGGTEKAHGVLKAYRGPRLRIWEIQVEGPHVEAWPTAGHRALYGDLKPEQLNAATIARRLEAFAEKAFRRPPLTGELEPIQQLVTAKLKEGVKPLQALQLGCQAILCSPGFLYLNLGEGELSEVALASRLSYFLWASPPDATLLKLAAAGKLRANLSAQVERMLADPRSERFIRHFVRRWLDLDNIGTMPPSADFLVFYRDNLEAAMRRETELFFRHLLDHNRPPREFLDADYSFLNRELALHYGIDGVEGNALKRVSLKGTGRGGLMGQGAFLTASANGVDTSPVVRGIYVLEKLLGYTPPPPPPDVPTIEPDIRGAVTIRGQLEKHREIATCAECHRKIDPLGFALENFDAIGGWRTEYGRNLPVDASGKLPDGATFKTPDEFRRLMAGRHEQFTRNLTEKLLTYALGRELIALDRPQLDAITTRMKQPHAGLRDLVEAVVLSKAFQSN